MSKLLIYGATGYTGTMIAEEAKKRGLHFEIAGLHKNGFQSPASAFGEELLHALPDIQLTDL